MTSSIRIFSLDTWAGIVDMARQQDVNLLCFVGWSLHDPRGFQAQANIIYELVTSENVDGLISWASVIGAHVTVEQIEAFHRRYGPFPTVTIGRTIAQGPGVLADSYDSMRDAIVHLLKDHHYRRVAFIRGPESHVYAQGRYQAYVETLETFGLPLDPDLITPPAAWGHDTGKEAIRLLLDERGLQPTHNIEAIVAVSEEVLFGALEALQERGVQVPNDIAVITFDDTLKSQTHNPPITTVAVPFYDIGQQACQQLIALCADQPVPRETVFPAKLIVRQSCGCLDPMVMQTMIQPAAGQDRSLETLLASERDHILLAMAQAMDQTAGNMAPHWSERLLDSLMGELYDKTAGTFIRELDQILRRAATKPASPQGQTVVAAGKAVSAWQNVLWVMRQQLWPYMDGKTFRQAENLWQQAHILIANVTRQVDVRQYLQAELQTTKLQEIGQTMLTTFDVDRLGEVIAKALPQLGIPSCYLALYENPQPYRYPQPAPKWSRLVVAHNENGRIKIEPGGRRFRSHKLMPAGMWPQGRQYCFIVSPLYFRENQLGFILYEVGPLEGSVYETLRTQLSNALQGALLVSEIKQTQAALEQAYAEVEEKVKKRTRQLQQEIADRKQAEEELKRYREHLEELVIERTLALEETQAELVHQERLSALGQIIATVAHEIRNPLGTVRNSVFSIRHALERGQLSRIEPALQRAERNIIRCDNIITELLDYTRTHELKLQTLYLDEWLQRILAELPLPTGTTLTVDVTKGVEITLDPERFRRVIVNLVDNACQAMQGTLDSSRQNLHIQTEIVDNKVKLSLTDTGPGIPPEIMPHIFEPLYSTKSFGVGLGLPVVAGIVKQHGGKIEVNSEPGIGTQVIVWLPVAASNGEI